jgi:hypothetical protein
MSAIFVAPAGTSSAWHVREYGIGRIFMFRSLNLKVNHSISPRAAWLSLTSLNSHVRMSSGAPIRGVLCNSYIQLIDDLQLVPLPPYSLQWVSEIFLRAWPHFPLFPTSISNHEDERYKTYPSRLGPRSCLLLGIFSICQPLLNGRHITSSARSMVCSILVRIRGKPEIVFS